MEIKFQKAVTVLGEVYIVNALTNGKVVVNHADGWSAGFRITTEARTAAGLPALDEREERQGLWLQCDNCNGTGKHSQHMGVISTEDWEDEDLDRYFAGDYDKPCACRTGFVWMDAKHDQERFDNGDGCDCMTCIAELEYYAQEELAIRRAEGYDYE
jgi:hypothetical protein